MRMLVSTRDEPVPDNRIKILMWRICIMEQYVMRGWLILRCFFFARYIFIGVDTLKVSPKAES